MTNRRFFAAVSLLGALAVIVGMNDTLIGAPGGGHGGGGHGGGGSSGGGHSAGGFSGGARTFGGGSGHVNPSGAFTPGGGRPSAGSYRPNGGASQWNYHTPSGVNRWTPHGGDIGRYVGPGRAPYVRHDWDHYFRPGGWARNWDSYYHYHHYYPVFYGSWWPFWGFDLGFYSYYYPRYTYIYTYDVCPYDGYAYQYEPSAAPVAVAGQPDNSAAVSMTTAYPPASDGSSSGIANADAAEYYSAARSAFAQGDYRNAMRLASHAAVEDPQNAQVHELMSLALLGAGDYRGAATEAHLALVMGPPSDWATLSACYGDAEKYTTQLRALEKYVVANPASAPARFLLAYQYLMTGHSVEAKKQMATAVKLTPKDKLAEHILKQLEAGQPVSPPKVAAPTTPETPPAAPAAQPPAPGPQEM